ncbi:MAG: phage major capsid protein [Betaproteobacteria bacterium]|nr:phage major capsid protein [Betaproteobacteria bacterium]
MDRVQMRGGPAGIDFARRAIALAVRRPQDAAQYAAERWGANSVVATEIRMAAVAGGSSTDADHAAVTGTHIGPASFLGLVRPDEILGKLQARMVAPHVPIVTQTGGATALWTESGKAAPVSRTAFTRQAIRPLRAPALIIYSADTLEYSSPAVEQMVLDDMRRAAIEASDTAFIDATNAGVADKIPRSVTYAAPSFVSSGVIGNDIAAAIEIFEGDLAAAAWVMHPVLAARIALSFGIGYAARLGPRGGVLLDMPVITSSVCTFDSSGGVIALVDASSIAVADAGIEVMRSTSGSVEMDDEPTGDTTVPTGMTTTSLVSLFQADSVGIRVSRRVNWVVGRQNAVVTITGATYEGS